MISAGEWREMSIVMVPWTNRCWNPKKKLFGNEVLNWMAANGMTAIVVLENYRPGQTVFGKLANSIYSLLILTNCGFVPSLFFFF